MERIKALNKPMVLVALAGGALDLSWADKNVNAILFGWYPGALGGDAIADLIFGVRNPSGKTPVTFYKTLDELPPFDDYSMEGRTYRYMKNEPLYPFGYGLSYTTFEMDEGTVSGSAENHDLQVTVSVKNVGEVAGEEVVEIYAVYDKERYITPNCKLCGFERVSLNPGEEKTITIQLETEAIKLTDRDGTRYIPKTVRFRVAPHAFLK